MKTTKWILACALAVSMTAATIWAQKDAYKDTGKSSTELDMLVDLAEMDLLADMLESLLREETVNEFGDLITLIKELSFNRDPVGIVNDVAHDFTDLGKTYEYACSVVVAQAALNVVFRVQIGIDMRFDARDISDLIYKLFFLFLIHMITSCPDIPALL